MMVKSQGVFFKPKWTLTVLTIVAVWLFLLLARWQVDRAEEKQALLDLNIRQRQAPVLTIHGDERLMEDRLRYRSVTVTGAWDSDHQLLLDNRIWQGRVGYEVFTPFAIEGSRKLVLVNRGWVAANPNRTSLPEVSLPRRRVTISGMVDRFPVPGWHLSGMEAPTPGWPAVVQQVEPNVIEERLGRPLMDFQIKLAPHEADGYVREWQLDFIDPHRNLGYALQWSLFALIALGLWIRHGFKRAREIRRQQLEHG